MLKKNALLISGLLTVLAVTPAMAGSWSFGVMGGLSSPTGDFGKDTKQGLNAGAAVDYSISDIISIGVDGSWNTNEHKDVGTTDQFGVTWNEDKFTIIQAGAHAKFMVPMAESPIKPYGILGLGIFNIKENYKYTVGGVQRDQDYDIAQGNFKQPGTRFGGKVGAGAMYKLTDMVGIGAEGALNFITLEKPPGGGNSNAQYVSLQAGLTFTPTAK